MSSIITKRGDKGQTDLLFGKSAGKADRHIHALGAVDELTASLGLARVSGCSETVSVIIHRIQTELIGLMGLCAVVHADVERYISAGYSSLSQANVEALETDAAVREAKLPKITSWVIPGAKGNLAAARMDVARGICRRAEREVVALWHAGEQHLELPAVYLNRLSDLLWILARELEAA
jgi:cob(I)alamin adenosyltransferase